MESSDPTLSGDEPRSGRPSVPGGDRSNIVVAVPSVARAGSRPGGLLTSGRARASRWLR